ncbi:PIN domain nuclease [Trinickia diaoshuihuensis]|uniref:type II toxin-antitoxin system VapC family toxin n=1 Tax=Trinickia diaoshuihuensis TaxID=2292265 RepID=UPI000E27265D|nr:PIN domain nuclease [Trinickia diaoshuihuensis]
MILVDSSVWIDYLKDVRSAETTKLDVLLGAEEIISGDLIVAEVLQGVRSEREFNLVKQTMTGTMRVLTLAGEDIAVQAARNYRYLRAQGVTIRKTIDSIIATYCIENHVPLLFSDRDFNPFVEHLGLWSAMHDD